jgi:hypothetical protein
MTGVVVPLTTAMGDVALTESTVPLAGVAHLTPVPKAESAVNTCPLVPTAFFANTVPLATRMSPVA